MPKRSVSKPYSKRESEQKLVNQRFYGKMENEPPRVSPVFLERPHYGIPDPVKINQSSTDTD
jgi:hypothetical protein